MSVVHDIVSLTFHANRADNECESLCLTALRSRAPLHFRSARSALPEKKRTVDNIQNGQHVDKTRQDTKRSASLDSLFGVEREEP